ncbi:cc-nbs-lrr resistance protein [Corchorus capsularis]|uniref:Cc-nbs-lrr resistance protein n=1 Tax=Corchorus capsularis TaxID=210143 RepID=A0A1R3KDV6_COCAP|nr:cc-nbs-lrr resistance protein [Corchorus capsularis]
MGQFQIFKALELGSVIARVGDDSFTFRVKRNVINHSDEFSIGDLENLDLLHGQLYIWPEGGNVDKEEAKRAKLHKKIHLAKLKLPLLDMYKIDQLIEALNLPPSLGILYDADTTVRFQIRLQRLRITETVIDSKSET